MSIQGNVAMASSMFPLHTVRAVTGILMTIAIGYGVSPAIGGKLYEIWGYSGPFLFTAAINAVPLPFFALCFKGQGEDPRSRSSSNQDEPCPAPQLKWSIGSFNRR